MRKKILSLLMICIVVFGLTGCGKSTEQKEEKKEEKKEVTLNSAYILDYEDKNYLGSENQAYMIVVFNINPKKDILLDNVSMTMKIGDKTVTGSKYDHKTRADIVYDSYSNIKSGDSGKLAYIFRMEKYLYKENDTFSIDYNVGTQKGEYSYIIEDTLSFKKEKIKEVDYLEDIVKGVYKEKADDDLMILSLKWKINDVYDRANAYDKYIKNDIYTWSNHQCYSNGARKDGKKILNYFTEGAENNISISNKGFLNVGVENPEITYELPALNYDTLEKYYPGIKEPLTELRNITNEYANGLINVNESGNGECYRDMYITDIRSKAYAVDDILKK